MKKITHAIALAAVTSVSIWSSALCQSPHDLPVREKGGWQQHTMSQLTKTDEKWTPELSGTIAPCSAAGGVRERRENAHSVSAQSFVPEYENQSWMKSVDHGDSADLPGSTHQSPAPAVAWSESFIEEFDIIGLSVDQKSNGYVIRIHCTRLIPELESWLKPIGNNTWLYITIADAKADIAVLRAFALTAFVKEFIIFESATSIQLTFRFEGPVHTAEFVRVAGNRDILVSVLTPLAE
jgi:hypothetical protein